MDKKQLQELNGLIRGAHLQGQSDRTLLLGEGHRGHVHERHLAKNILAVHVYIKGGIINICLYNHSGIIEHNTEEEIEDNRPYVEKIEYAHLYPSDFEFCSLLKQRGYNIELSDLFWMEESRREKYAPYWGKIPTDF